MIIGRVDGGTFGEMRFLTSLWGRLGIGLNRI